MNLKPSFLSNIPPVTLNLLIINVIFFLASEILQAKFDVNLNNFLALYFVKSPFFQPFQIISYMFMHGNLYHLFCNMFAVYMFGQIFEHFWGGWKYLLYYFTAGIGAALVQEIIWYIDFNAIMQNIEFHKFELVKENGWKILQQGENYTDLYAGKLNILFHVPTIGASGAVFGILLAFGVMFPHERIYFMFMLPIQARFFVIIYGIAELFFGVANFSGDNVAHFAHLGGLFFGLLLILWWKHKGKLFNHKIF